MSAERWRKMLALEAVSKVYPGGGVALRELSLVVTAGRIVTLLGHNGAGKSTTLKIAAGIIAPTSGSVTISGRDLQNAKADVEADQRRQVGFLPEEAHLLESMTPSEFLWYVGQLYGIEDEGELASRIRSWTERLAVEGAEDCPLRELSAGQRRRVSIIAALLNGPKLLLLDEPTNFLDPIGVKILKDVLVSLRNEGCASLLATHRLDVAEQLSDVVVVLDHGVAIFQGSLMELHTRAPSASPGAPLEVLYAGLVGN